MEGSKKYIGSPVRTPDGSLGTIVAYDEKKDSYDVELDAGKVQRFSPADLNAISLGGKGGPPPGSGGSEDW